MTNLCPRVFVDFDGTITKRDIGNEFFRKFGNEAELVKAVAKWKAGEMSGRDLTLKEAEFVRVDKEEALKFVGAFEIDSAFKNFVSYCKTNSIEVTVLSDGLDFYIKKIFEVNGISSVPFYSNLAYLESGRVRIEFPFESDCQRCGNCKGFQILTRTGIDDVVIYVGNGYSDRCAIQYTDITFAKDELLKYCEENNIAFFPFQNFGNVISKLDKISRTGKFRKRHRAELKRIEAYLSE